MSGELLGLLVITVFMFAIMCLAAWAVGPSSHTRVAAELARLRKELARLERADDADERPAPSRDQKLREWAQGLRASSDPADREMGEHLASLVDAEATRRWNR